MGKGKRRVFRVGFLAIIAVYLAVIAVEYACNPVLGRKAIYETHLDNLRQNGALYDGLILGGSNSYYSLSAGLMSERLGMQFYNASLANEGFTGIGYDRFIRDDVGARLDRTKIRLVVYSSALLTRPGVIAKYIAANNRTLWGSGTIGIRPYDSIFNRREKLAGLLFGDGRAGELYPFPDARGDLDFNTASCRRKIAEIGKTESLDAIIALFRERHAVIRKTFPQARIVFVTASEFYGNKLPPAEAIRDLTNRFTETFKDDATLVIQPPLPDREYVCDFRHHTNSTGRVWRTEDLVSTLKRLQSQ